MESETGLSREELEVISNVAGKFYGGVKWDPRWEFEDLRQELARPWLLCP
jgi:DNA topoisomerase VI subunit A